MITIMMHGRCPKCGGYIVHGDVRFGHYAPDISRCLLCGLHSEQAAYYDAIKQAYRDMLPPHQIVPRAYGEAYR